MPLLLCPNDNSTMQTVQRSGVEFDICPTCRGVWLDRGELEKLLDAAGRDVQPDGASDQRMSHHRAPAPQDYRPRHRDWDDDDDRRHYKRRRPSIFDIFD